MVVPLPFLHSLAKCPVMGLRTQCPGSRVIKTVSGQNLDVFLALAHTIFKPLDMTDTGFLVSTEITSWDPADYVGEYGWGGAASTHYWVSP